MSFPRTTVRRDSSVNPGRFSTAGAGRGGLPSEELVTDGDTHLRPQRHGSPGTDRTAPGPGR